VYGEITVVVVDVVPSKGKSSVEYSSRGLLTLTGRRSRDGIAYREIQCVVNCLPTTAGENTLAVLQGQCAERAVQGGVPGKDVAFRAICAARLHENSQWPEWRVYFVCLAMVTQIMRLGLTPVMHACDAQL